MQFNGQEIVFCAVLLGRKAQLNDHNWPEDFVIQIFWQEKDNRSLPEIYRSAPFNRTQQLCGTHVPHA